MDPVYHAVFAAIALAAFSPSMRARRHALILISAALSVLVGTRYRVGMDWSNYEAIHQYVGQRPLLFAIKRGEPLSGVLIWLSHRLTGGQLLSNCFAGLVLIGGVRRISQSTMIPLVAFVAAVPYLILVIGQSALRQSIAVGILMYGIPLATPIGNTRRVLTVLIAALFHTSALSLFAVFLVLGKPWSLRVMLRAGFATALILAGILTFMPGAFSTSLTEYQSQYLGVDAVQSAGAAFHVALVVLPAAGLLLMAHARQLRASIPDSILQLALLSLALLALLAISSTVASRMAVYLFAVPMWSFAATVSSSGPNSRAVGAFFVIILHWVEMMAWFEYANNAHAFRDYRSYLVMAQ